MKILLFLSVYLSENWVDLEDGEPMEISLNAKGKQFLNFKVDGESFTVDLKSKSAVEHEESIPENISQQLLQEKFYDDLIKSEFEKEKGLIAEELNSMSVEQRQQMEDNLWIKILTAKGVLFKDAVQYVKNKNEKQMKFSENDFWVNLEEFVQNLKNLFKDENMGSEDKYKQEMLIQAEIDNFIEKQMKLLENNQENIQISVKIENFQNLIKDYFVKINQHYNSETKFEEQELYLKAIEKEIEEFK